jgi:predicted ABC-type ATPase
VVAVPNGSGITTFTEKLLRHEWMKDCQYINPDLIAQKKFGAWNSPAAVSILKDF